VERRGSVAGRCRPEAGPQVAVSLGIVAGDVVFIAALTPADNILVEWGSLLYIAAAGRIFADGFESGDTSRW